MTVLQGMTPLAPALLAVALIARVIVGQHHPSFYVPLIAGYVLAALTVDPTDLRVLFVLVAAGCALTAVVQHRLKARRSVRDQAAAHGSM